MSSKLHPYSCPFCHKTDQFGRCVKCGTTLPGQDPRPLPPDSMRIFGQLDSKWIRNDDIEARNYTPIKAVGDTVQGNRQ